MTTRRQLLAAAIAAPAITIPSSAEALICAPNATSSAWTAAMRRLREAENAVSRYYHDVFVPAHDAWQARKAAVAALVDDVPHYTTKRAYDTQGGQRKHMTTARPIDTALAKTFAESPSTDGSVEFQQACDELYAAFVQREQEIERIKAANPVAPIPANIRAELDRLERESSHAFREVAGFEASTLSDLRAKIEYLKTQDCEIEHDEMLADLARVFGEARL